MPLLWCIGPGMLGKDAFPTWLLTLLLILLLGFLSWKMMQKALQLHAKEEAARAEHCGGQSPRTGQVGSFPDHADVATHR